MVARNSTPATLSATVADQNSEGARAIVSAPLLAVPRRVLYVPVIEVNIWLLRNHQGPPDLSRFDALLDLGPYGKLIASRFITEPMEVEEQCDTSSVTSLSAPDFLASSPY